MKQNHSNPKNKSANHKISDGQAFCALASTTGLATQLGSVTVATMTTTTPAWGVAGWLGFTTTTTAVLSLPVAGLVVAGGAFAWGGYRVLNALKEED